MFTSRLLAFAFCLLSFAKVSGQTAKTSNFHLGFCYPFSTNGYLAPEYTNAVSLHLVAGVSASEKSVCLAGLANVVRDSAAGLVASGCINIIGDKASGAQLAGMANIIGGDSKGLLAAGAANIVAGSAQGAQLAGFVNIISDGSTGMQAAGFANITPVAEVQLAGFANITSKAKGAQLAGFANIADTAEGVQLAGFLNIADTMAGMQVAGFVNVASTASAGQIAGFVNVADKVGGPQIAGFINIANKVAGPQIAGFINIADSSDCPVGIINLIKKGEKAIGVTIDESGTRLAAFRSGGKYLYGVIGLGYNFGSRYNLYALQAGIGAHLPISKAVRISGELSVTSLTDFWWGNHLISSVRVLPSVRIGKVEFFAGPSFNFGTYDLILGNVTVPQSLWRHDTRFQAYDMYVGFMGGLQVHF